jgi:hypothetical protein
MGGTPEKTNGEPDTRSRFPEGSQMIRQRPTFPQPCGCSIIGPGGLNGRVRDGNGWNPSGMATGKRHSVSAKECDKLLKARTKRRIKPLDRLVLVHSNPCGPYMPSLSTWSSTRGLPAACAAGYLILRWVSRLDAFSSSPVPT